MPPSKNRVLVSIDRIQEESIGVSDHSYSAWNYRPSTGSRPGLDLVGYTVAAADGDIGKVDHAVYDTDSACLVVDTEPWIVGRKVMLPAGLVERIDNDDHKVHVDRTRNQIRDAPEYDPDVDIDVGYRERLRDYYGDTYREDM
jgi:hypothetical protein